jgi:cereblon
LTSLLSLDGASLDGASLDGASLDGASLDGAGPSPGGPLVPSTADPAALGWWAAANHPRLSETARQALLAEDSVAKRLSRLIEVETKRSREDANYILCSRCGAPLAAMRPIVMDLAGMMAAYANPAGFTHETLTLEGVLRETEDGGEAIFLQGEPSTESSWFPGYSWTIAGCRGCGRHLGWRFDTVAGLEPRRFWGLTRASLRLARAGRSADPDRAQTTTTEDEFWRDGDD